MNFFKRIKFFVNKTLYFISQYSCYSKYSNFHSGKFIYLKVKYRFLFSNYRHFLINISHECFQNHILNKHI